MSKFCITMSGALLICSIATTVAWADKKKNEDKPAERKPERKAPEQRRSEPKPAEQRQPERRPVEQKRVEQRVEPKRVEQPRPAPALKPAPTPRPERQDRQERPQLATPPTPKPAAKPQAQPTIRSAPSPAMANDSRRRNDQPTRNDQPNRQLPAPRPVTKPNGDRVKLAQPNSAISGFSAGAAGAHGRRDRDKDDQHNLPKPGPRNVNASPAAGPQPAIAGTQSVTSLKPKADPPKHHPKPRPTVKPDRDHDHDKPVVSTGIATGLAAGVASGVGRPNGKPAVSEHRPGDKDHAQPHHAATPGHQGHVAGPIARPYRSKPVVVHHDHHDDHHYDRVVHVDRHHHHYRGSRWIFIGSSGYGWNNHYAAPYGGGYNDSYSLTVINPQPVTVYSPTYLVEPDGVAPAPSSSPRPPQRAVPSADAFNEMPPQEQQKLMLIALNDLEGDLTQSDTGAEWVDHLQLASISKILTERDEPLDDAARLQLQAIADIFEEVAQDEEFKSVSQLWGFNVVNVSLHVMATDPVVCQRHRVSSAANALSQVFKSWQSADRWQTYLRLETLATMDDAPEDLIVRIQEVDVIATKFDRIQAEAQYQMIHELPAFRATHLALRSYLNDLRNIATELEPAR